MVGLPGIWMLALLSHRPLPHLRVHPLRLLARALQEGEAGEVVGGEGEAQTLIAQPLQARLLLPLKVTTTTVLRVIFSIHFQLNLSIF